MKIRIGTRKSRLALIQTDLFASAVHKFFPDIEIEIVNISTRGDEIIDRPLEKIGGKGVFTEAIENALLDGRIDFAVHSAKDMPVDLPEGLCVSAVLERSAPEDVIVFRRGYTPEENMKIGTSSRRRSIGIQKIYPQAVISDIRGNVDTRLDKLAAHDYDGIVLAAAGLERLGAFDDNRFDYVRLDTDTILPAPCQGIIAVESRTGTFGEILGAVNDIHTYYCYETERKILKLLDSGCSTPVGAYAYIKNNRINVSATPDQHRIFSGSGEIGDRIGIAERIVKDICVAKYT